MNGRLDVVVTATLVVCALVTTGLVLRREFLPAVATTVQGDQKPVFIKNWRNYLEQGAHVGFRGAPVELIEFADFECPFCGHFHEILQEARERHSTQMALTYVHFPLPGHRFALPAARVAECADQQGRFEAMHDRLFEQQEQFGLRPWTDFAKDAGVPDLPAFEACIQKTDPVTRVVEGQALGKQLDIQGTPTVIINGWKLGRPPTADELDGMVKAVLAGKSPVTSDGKFAQ